MNIISTFFQASESGSISAPLITYAWDNAYNEKISCIIKNNTTTDYVKFPYKKYTYTLEALLRYFSKICLSKYT